MTATLPRNDVPDRYGLEGDAQTRQWVSRAWRRWAGPAASRSQLLTDAQNRIALLTSADAPGRAQHWHPVDNGVASTAMVLLNVLIHSDNLATPQIAPTPEGGLNIEWLVDGDSLSLTMDDEGVSIIAQFDNGEYAFPPYSWDVGDGVASLNASLGTAVTSSAHFLEKISTGIQHRLIVR